MAIVETMTAISTGMKILKDLRDSSEASTKPLTSSRSQSSPWRSLTQR
jgi:hypothetical protein